MRAVIGAAVLLIVLVFVGLLAMRQTQSLAPVGVPATGVPSAVPAERARAAQQRAIDGVARAMEAASASRDAAEAK